jgi:hypothetical protein
MFDMVTGMASGLLDRLEGFIDELAAVDLDTLSDSELHDTVVALGRLSSRLEAAWCRQIGRWDARHVWADNGSKSAASRLSRESHWRKADCARIVRRARRLATMPHTDTAYAVGELCGTHVDLVASCNREWRNADFAESEELLVNLCRTPWFDNAVQAIQHWQLLADRDAKSRGADPAVEGRHLSASTGWRGELVINGALDPIGGETFKTELDLICEQLRLQDERDGAMRTVQQRRADALVEMAVRSATAPADGLRPRPLFTITLGIEHFTWMCQTAGGTVIAPDLLIPYLGDADIERIVYDPPTRRFEASQRRRFTGALRRIITIRDQYCQHPGGCDEPAHRCDVDHIVPVSDSGVTCLCNGQLLCAFHNRSIKAATRPTDHTPHPCPHDEHHVPADTVETEQYTGRAPPAAS